MSKKKPYSRIENGKTLRSLEFEYKRGCKKLAKDNAPEWYVRLAEEYHCEIVKVLKLRDFLWVKDTKDSEVRLSDEAQKVCPKALKLLLKQEKVMTAFCQVLDERIKLGWPKAPANPPCKEEAKKAPAKKAPAKEGK